jgi:hypothetical protein
MRFPCSNGKNSTTSEAAGQGRCQTPPRALRLFASRSLPFRRSSKEEKVSLAVDCDWEGFPERGLQGAQPAWEQGNPSHLGDPRGLTLDLGAG